METDEIPFRWPGGRGLAMQGAGRIYRPDNDLAPWPLIYVAGYEAEASAAEQFTKRGWVVVTPATPEEGAVWPGPNPLCRGLGMDAALLRVARRLPYVDDARVAITGGSAGGYMTLMTAAATFPLAGAFPAVPPVNLPYEVSCWDYDRSTISSLRPDGTTTAMAFAGNADTDKLLDGLLAQYGGAADPRMLAASPLAHLDRITCRVAVWFTTADVLVPYPQVGGPFTDRVIAGAPAIYPVDPALVCQGATAEAGRLRLLDLLDDSEVEVRVLDIPAGTPPMVDVNAEPEVVLAPPDHERRWLVMILDEGAPDPDIGHFRYSVRVAVDGLMAECFERPVEPGQLTAAKLKQLADRYQGADWIGLGSGVVDSAELEEERTDVLRGLRTYCSRSRDHEERFRKLYSTLSAEQQVFDHLFA